MKPSLLARILSGWREIGARVGSLVLLLAVCLLLGAAISLPLWWFATANRGAYTIAVAAAAGAGIVGYAVRRLIARGVPGAGRRALAGLGRGLVALARVLLLLAALALAAGLAARGRWLAAVPAVAVAVAVAAWIGAAAGTIRPR